MNRLHWALFCFWVLLIVALLFDAFWQWHTSGHFAPIPLLLLPGPLVASGVAFAKARKPFHNDAIGPL